MAKLDFKKLNDIIRYTMWSAFRATSGALGDNRKEVVAKTKESPARYEDTDLIIRGFYDASAMRVEVDFTSWIYAEKMEDLQTFYNVFLHETPPGQVSTPHWSNAMPHRPAEFNKSHLPSFIMGEEPERWIAAYPLVHSYDWYLLEPTGRHRIFAEHGTTGRGYPDARANTVPAFALGDYEWILAFEGPEFGRIVDSMWKVCCTEVYLRVREEIPFHTGRRVNDIAEIINVLSQPARYTRESAAPLVKAR